MVTLVLVFKQTEIQNLTNKIDLKTRNEELLEVVSRSSLTEVCLSDKFLTEKSLYPGTGHIQKDRSCIQVIRIFLTQRNNLYQRRVLHI